MCTESVIEQFAATPEGREHLDREEERLNAELAAVSELRAAAVAWYRVEQALHQKRCNKSNPTWSDVTNDYKDSVAASQRVFDAAQRLAELEEQ